MQHLKKKVNPKSTKKAKEQRAKEEFNREEREGDEEDAKFLKKKAKELFILFYCKQFFSFLL